MNAKFLPTLVIATSALVSMTAHAEDPSEWVREQMQVATSQTRSATTTASAQQVAKAAPAESKGTEKTVASTQTTVASKTTAQ